MPSTPAFKHFREAQEAQDFARACRAVSRIFTLTAQTLAREHSKQDADDTISPDLMFWPRLADRAQRAACLSQLYTQHGHSTAALCARLRRENLREFADALESGNYGDLCF